MVIRYLEILEAIAETGTFTGAAKKLYITQSAVSHAIAELEKQTGTPLFERFPKGVTLPHCGVSLLEEARNILTACSPDFPVSGQNVTLEQLCAYPLLLREQGSAIRDTLDHMLALSNLKAEPVWESVNSFALIKAAEAGLGITVLPEKLLSDSLLLKKLRIIHLDNMKMENQMLALFQKDKYITKPFQILIDHLKSKNEPCSF